jgi:nucleoside-diphosphate-sugar epimerase
MRIFITGTSGYIGGSVATGLQKAGHDVVGLVRNEATGALVERLGIAPVIGTLDDAALLAREAQLADVVINAADSDHRRAVEVLIEAIVHSGKALIHTSGSSIVGDDARGEFSERVYDEGDRPAPAPEKAARVAIDQLVLDAAGRGIRSAVICNTLIYGDGLGPKTDSIQIPALVGQARKSGVVRHVGRGLNVWSHVHVEDVVDLYKLVLDRALPGSFFFAENGEASFKEMAEAIADALGLGPPEPWPLEEATKEWGYERAAFALGSNSRVRGRNARQALGWTPRHGSVLDWIRRHVRP